MCYLTIWRPFYSGRHFSFRRCGINRDSDLIYNERVRWKEVRVIDENNGQLGLLTSEAALELAYSKGLDLIVVAPNATPPVCKIMDLGKYQYEQMKRQKEAKKKQVTVEMKEMKMQGRNMSMMMEPSKEVLAKMKGPGKE